MNPSDESCDYVWHFKLSAGDGQSVHPDALTEMVRRQLKALLDCVVLTHRGERVKVTGFRFLGEPDEHRIYAAAKEGVGGSEQDVDAERSGR